MKGGRRGLSNHLFRCGLTGTGGVFLELCSYFGIGGVHSARRNRPFIRAFMKTLLRFFVAFLCVPLAAGEVRPGSLIYYRLRTANSPKLRREKVKLEISGTTVWLTTPAFE